MFVLHYLMALAISFFAYLFTPEHGAEERRFLQRLKGMNNADIARLEEQRGFSLIGWVCGREVDYARIDAEIARHRENNANIDRILEAPHRCCSCMDCPTCNQLRDENNSQHEEFE